MARKKKEADEQESTRQELSRESVRRALRFTGWTLALVAVVFCAALALLQGEQFLTSDQRFRLAESGSRAQDDAITVTGLKHASRAAVLRVFADDRGRSIADVDPEKRRMQLKRVDWVRDASVRRIWPNQLHVDVEERCPVAFIQVASGVSGSFSEPMRFVPMLIDADGIILPLRGDVPQGLPLLMGVRERDDIERRRTRVLLMMRVLDELREARSRIPEVDVTDPESVRITYQLSDHQVVLVLGNERFLERLNIFLRHYEGIKDRLPQRAVLDVSLEGRITAIQPLEGSKQ